MTPRTRVVNIIGIRVDHHCQYLLFASLKYGTVKLSVMCVLLCLQLWATTTSFLLQGTLKTTRSPTRLVFEAARPCTSFSRRFYTDRLIPRLGHGSASCVYIPVYVSSHRVPRNRSSTDVSCLGYVYASVHRRKYHVDHISLR